jgi:hypothetical protein
MLIRLLLPLLLVTAVLPFTGHRGNPSLKTTVQPIELTPQLTLEDGVARYRPRYQRGSGRRSILSYGVSTPSSLS